MSFLKNNDRVSEVFFIADEIKIKMMGKDKSRIMKANWIWRKMQGVRVVSGTLINKWKLGRLIVSFWSSYRIVKKMKFCYILSLNSKL